MCVGYTLKINHLQTQWSGFNIKIDHFEAHLMVPSRELDFKVLRMAPEDGRSVLVLFLIKRQNGKCNVRNFRRVLFDMSPDVPAFKVRLTKSLDKTIRCTLQWFILT